MEKIKFLKDTENEYSVNITTVKAGVIKIEFETVIPASTIYLSGFNVYNENNGKIMGIYTDYKTEYNAPTDSAVYVSTGEVYVEPEVIPVTLSEPVEPKVLTEEELAAIEKNNQINVLSSNIMTYNYQIESTNTILARRYEIDLIVDEELKASQLAEFEIEYPDIQAVIAERISLREQIKTTQAELDALFAE